jgi:hypothetical protein
MDGKGEGERRPGRERKEATMGGRIDGWRCKVRTHEGVRSHLFRPHQQHQLLLLRRLPPRVPRRLLNSTGVNMRVITVDYIRLRYM